LWRYLLPNRVQTLTLFVFLDWSLEAMYTVLYQAKSSVNLTAGTVSLSRMSLFLRFSAEICDVVLRTFLFVMPLVALLGGSQ
jgi:hypothetical protein